MFFIFKQNELIPENEYAPEAEILGFDELPKSKQIKNLYFITHLMNFSSRDLLF
jgi:hypothetical protein